MVPIKSDITREELCLERISNGTVDANLSYGLFNAASRWNLARVVENVVLDELSAW